MQAPITGVAWLGYVIVNPHMFVLNAALDIHPMKRCHMIQRIDNRSATTNVLHLRKRHRGESIQLVLDSR